MKNFFHDILRMDDMKGVLLLGRDGTMLFQKLLQSPFSDLKCLQRLARVPELRKAQELEFLYEHDRIYMRKLGGGLIIVWTGVFAPIAMIRLSCDVLIPSLEKTLSSKGWRRLLK